MSLIRFSVSNYRSIAEKQVLEMEAAKLRVKSAKILEQRNAFQTPDGKRRLLHTAVIYGANASGKSNLIFAMKTMRELVCASASEKDWHRAVKAPVRPFRFDPVLLDKPSRFEVSFFQEGVRYDYGFAIRERGGRQSVEEEWLYAYPHGRRRLWFKRQGQEWRYGPSFKGEKATIQAMTRPDALFLSVGDLLNHPQLKRVWAWFCEKFTVLTSSSTEDLRGYSIPALPYSVPPHPSLHLPPSSSRHPLIQKMIKLWLENDGFRQWLQHFLVYADLGIVGIEVEIKDKYHEVKTLHVIHDEEGRRMIVKFDLEDEAGGVKHILALSPLLWRALQNSGVLVMDDLGQRLHPLLLRLLVMLFQTPMLGSSGAQLVFTTHDATLLDPAMEPRLFRRDQIYFMEKDERQASQLYSLADFDEREDASFMRRYLYGIYGAIPGTQVWLDSLRDGVMPSEWPLNESP